jgi:hypothetical protein
VAPAIETADESAQRLGAAENASTEPEDVLDTERSEEARRRSSEPLGGE